MTKYGRRKPYTERGISRVPCFRCGNPSRFQWQACSLGDRWIAVCAECDVGLNQAALRYTGVPGWEKIIANYAKSKGVEMPTSPLKGIAAALPKGPVRDCSMPPYHYQKPEFGSGFAIQRSKS